MIPRECDNDDCDYETGVDGAGRPRARWVHDPACEGPVEFVPPTDVPDGSFLAYLAERSPAVRRMLTRD